MLRHVAELLAHAEPVVDAETDKAATRALLSQMLLHHESQIARAGGDLLVFHEKARDYLRGQLQ